jgi:hypothetical protein
MYTSEVNWCSLSAIMYIWSVNNTVGCSGYIVSSGRTNSEKWISRDEGRSSHWVIWVTIPGLSSRDWGNSRNQDYWQSHTWMRDLHNTTQERHLLEHEIRFMLKVQFSGIFRSNVTLRFMSGMSANHCPFRAFFNFGKSQKSQGANLGE